MLAAGEREGMRGRSFGRRPTGKLIEVDGLRPDCNSKIPPTTIYHSTLLDLDLLCHLLKMVEGIGSGVSLE
jgi:hypothetical protein